MNATQENFIILKISQWSITYYPNSMLFPIQKSSLRNKSTTNLQQNQIKSLLKIQQINLYQIKMNNKVLISLLKTLFFSLIKRMFKEEMKIVLLSKTLACQTTQYLTQLTINTKRMNNRVAIIFITQCIQESIPCYTLRLQETIRGQISNLKDLQEESA